MNDGYLLVDKPAGPTSHDVVAVVRRAIGVRRVGHTGTLDPFASGLLVMLVGRATRLAQFIVGQPKRYAGTVRLGITTDSGDRTGTVTGTDDAWTILSQQEIEAAMSGLVGPQRQRPPAFSAKKIAGERAYRLARRGQPAELAENDVEIFSFALTGITGPDLSFEAKVSSGTYVRALARDLGGRLGCGAHLVELRRTAVGSFEVAGAPGPDAITPKAIRPAREVLAHLQFVTVNEADCESLRSGRAVTTPEPLTGSVAVMADDELVAVADAHGTQLQPRVVFP